MGLGVACLTSKVSIGYSLRLSTLAVACMGISSPGPFFDDIFRADTRLKSAQYRKGINRNGTLHGAEAQALPASRRVHLGESPVPERQPPGSAGATRGATATEEVGLWDTASSEAKDPHALRSAGTSDAFDVCAGEKDGRRDGHEPVGSAGVASGLCSLPPGVREDDSGGAAVGGASAH